MLKAIIILIMSLFIWHIGFGQKLLTITGVLRDSKGEALSKATLMLEGGSDTLRVISGKDGDFEFSVPQSTFLALSHKVLLVVTMQGYKRYTTVISLKADQRGLVLPPIVLLLEFEELVPVMVVAVKPITIREDTVEYHAGAYKVRPGAELERLMKLLPGITWDTGGNLMAGGKKLNKIMINGLDFAGGDIKTALQNLPADIIDKVQVIDDYGDKGRLTGVKSGEADKVLNVVLKEDKRYGKVINFGAGIGDKGKYSSSLFSDMFSGDHQWTANGYMINVSPSGVLNENRLELGGVNKYSAKTRDNARLTTWGKDESSTNTLHQSNYFAGSQTQLEQRNEASTSKQNEGVSYTVTYVPNVNTQLRVSGFMNMSHSRDLTTSDFLSIAQDSGFTKKDSGQTHNLTVMNGKTSQVGLYFEKIDPHSKERFSFEATYDYSGSVGNGDNYNKTYVNTDSLSNYDNQHYLIHLTNLHQELNTKLSYYYPLGKEGLLEMGYAWDYSVSGNNQITRVPDSLNGNLITVDSLSNNYAFTIKGSRIHVGYLSHSKKMNLSVGVDGQQWNQQSVEPGKDAEQRYNYFKALPQADLTYSMSPSKALRFDYRGTSNAPSLQQLQPVINITNPQYPVQGNPNLKPSYTNAVDLWYTQTSLSATQFWNLSVGVSYNTTSGMIITNLLSPRDSSSVIQQTEFLNANGSWSLGLDYRLDLPAIFDKRLRVSTFGGFGESQNATMTNNILYTVGSVSWKQNLSIGVVIPDLLEEGLSLNYTYTVSKYSISNGQSHGYPALDWSFQSAHEIMPDWTLRGVLTQSFTSTPGKGLTANPMLVNASVEKRLFPRNQLRVNLSVSDVLNSSSGVSQAITPTGVTQYRASLIGRYFLLSATLKLEKFHSKRTTLQ
jgi:hypothetical protein